jgi:hypothetical protein
LRFSDLSGPIPEITWKSWRRKGQARKGTRRAEEILRQLEQGAILEGPHWTDLVKFTDGKAQDALVADLAAEVAKRLAAGP